MSVSNERKEALYDLISWALAEADWAEFFGEEMAKINVVISGATKDGSLDVKFADGYEFNIKVKGRK